MENEIQSLLNTLYKKHKTLNPFSLAESLSIDVKYVPFEERPYGNFRIILDTAIIFIHRDKKNEHFYICAHELYHAIAHKNRYYNYQTNIVAKAKMELEANLFASKLILNDYLLKYKQVPENFNTIQSFYGLSDEMEEYFI